MDWSIDRILAVAGIGLAFIALIVGLGSTLAISATTRGELRFAKTCFAVAAVMLMFSTGVWGVTTETSALKRVLIVAICFALLGVSIVETLRWAQRRHMHSSSNGTKLLNGLSKEEASNDISKHYIHPTPETSGLTKTAKAQLTPSKGPSSPKTLRDRHGTEPIGTEASHAIRVMDEKGNPLRGAEILLVQRNGTHSNKIISDDLGIAAVAFPGQILSIFCAHKGFAGYYQTDYDQNKPLIIRLKVEPNGGSVIITDGVGYIPDLSGRLNPILDTQGRTYLYAENIAIDGGKPQPVNFSPSRFLTLQDSNGNEFMIEIVAILANSSLITYRRVQPAK